VRSLPLPSFYSAVRRVRPTETQTDLGIEERLENVRGAFALTKGATALRGKNLLLVDDVMTTGATLASLGETLAEIHPRAIHLIALAAVPP
jgi:predicted amidophosphoribosyltransferase